MHLNVNAAFKYKNGTTLRCFVQLAHIVCINLEGKQKIKTIYEIQIIQRSKFKFNLKLLKLQWPLLILDKPCFRKTLSLVSDKDLIQSTSFDKDI